MVDPLTSEDLIGVSDWESVTRKEWARCDECLGRWSFPEPVGGICPQCKGELTTLQWDEFGDDFEPVHLKACILAKEFAKV